MITFQEFKNSQISESSTPAQLIGRLEKAIGKKLSPGLNTINNIDVNILDTESGDTSIQIELISPYDLGKLTKYLKGLRFSVSKVDKENIEIS